MITHVAIRFQGKVWSLPRPYRHHHIFRVVCFLDPTVERIDSIRENQGFLNETGRYLTRDEGEAYARECGQLTKPIIGGELTSEDLW